MKRYDLRVADVTMPLEITLVWTDYPAQAWADPILVNDLDLIVTAPDGTAYRGNAFTGYNPGESEPGAANADHMNNVESVLVVSGVQTGIWTVEVAGCNVPEGPQPFALSMTGGFVSEQGSFSMDRERYRSSALVNLTLSDLGLNTDSDSVESAVVSVNSTTEPVPEVLTLTETGAATAVFAGQIQLVLSPVPVAGDGILQVQNGDALTIEYIDADDGFGASQSVFDWARVDDDPPVISGARTGEIRFSRATVLWSTDEPSDSIVFYDSSLPLSMIAGSGSEVSVHEVVLSDLQEDTTYYFSVRSADGAGNVRTDDNGGAYYTFSTPGRPPPPPVGSDWSTLRSNSARTGEIKSKMAPPLAQEIVMGPYAVGSADEPLFADGVFFSIIDLEDTIVAIDPFSQTVLWKRTLGDPLFYTGTPAYNNGTIYATFYGYSGGKVYALDALTGQTKWCVGPESGLDFNARIGMAYADGLVFGTSWNGEVYSLNASDGSTVWSYQTDLLPWSGSAVSEGRVFVPIVEDYLVVLDEFTGSLLWSVPIPNIGYTSLVPVASAGVLYMVVGDTIYSLNAADGTILWQTSGLPFGWGRTSPAFDGSALYWGAYDIVDGLGYFWAVNASDGSIIWRTPVGPTDICSSIAYSNGYVYGATFSSDLYTLRAADGAVVDVDPLLRLGFGYPVSLVASDGWVWVEDGDGWLRGFRAQVPAGLTVSPAHQSVNARPGSTSDCLVEVRNTGSIATDTFDVVISPGAHGWPITLLDADSMLPLVDTDVDGLLDSGPISSNASVSIVVRVSVPVASLQGDEEVCSVDFKSSSDPSIWRKATVRTVLPMPGVIVEGSRFIASASGREETAIINITNSGSAEDVFDLDVSSSLGWSFGLLDESGTTPLQDNDGDGRIDTDIVQGLGKTSILLKVQVAAGAAFDAVNRVMIAANSSLDTDLSDRVCVRIEVLAPPPSAWPSFQHDSWRSGNASDPVALPIRKVWTYPGTGFGSLYTSPIAANGTVFYSSSSGYLMAVDAFTGEGKWALKLGSEYMAISTPTYNEGVVYIAYCEANSPRSQISALDAGTAAILWTNSMLGWTRGAPVLKGGVVFLGDSYGAIYAFNATSGDQVWLGQVHGGIAWSISIIDGLLIGGTASGELFAMDLDGSIAWSRTLTSFLPQGAIMAAPCGGGGRVYISESQGTLWALDSQTGEVLWTRMDVGWPLLSSPAYEGETVYYASHMGVFAFDAGNGSTRWRVTGDNVQFFGSPMVSNGTVFAVQYQGFLYAIDAETGLVSYALLANTWSFGSSPASAYGYVYVLDEEGVLCAFTYAGGPDLPPTANAGPDQVVPQGANVMFDGSMSSDDYGILSYNWTILELGIEMSGVNPRHLFLDAGVFTVELVVIDCIGQVSSPDYMTETLEDCLSPVAEAGPDQTINLGEAVILNGSSCTDNVGVVNWTWSFYDNGWRSLYGELVAYTFSAPGNYTVTLQAYDARGNIASDWMTVNVNAPPVADAGPDQTVMGGELVLFDGSASYDDVNIVNWTWTFDYDGSTVVLYGPNPTFTFWIEGVYEVTLTVNDTAGHTSTDTVQITVSGMIPEFPTLLLPVIGMAAVVLVSRLRKRR
jgi:outer membrane protein assembly factor BamB